MAKYNFNLICSKIDEYRQKACAWQSEAKANALQIELKKILPDEDYWKLVIARSHYKLGEGSSELYDVCKELILKHNI